MKVSIRGNRYIFDMDEDEAEIMSIVMEDGSEALAEEAEVIWRRMRQQFRIATYEQEGR